MMNKINKERLLYIFMNNEENWNKIQKNYLYFFENEMKIEIDTKFSSIFGALNKRTVKKIGRREDK